MRTLGYAGAERAADHADRQDPLWRKIAWARALEFISHLGRKSTFTSEALRAWAEEHSCPPPPDPRAWGNVTKRLVSKGLIVDTQRRVLSTNKRCHGREIVLWIVA